MVNVVSAIRKMESHKKVPGGIAAGGICFVLLGISGLFGILTTGALLAIGMFFVALAMMTYNLLSPVDQRFELGTQSAEHQYGPFRIVVESAIEFKGAKEMEENDFKIRTVRCKAVTEDGETIASEREDQVVGSRPLTVKSWFSFSGGDHATVQSTEEHVREVSKRVKDDAVERIANGGNDPSLKAALEAEFGEEWRSDENKSDDSLEHSRAT